jgi:hypothetical protein
VSVTTQAPNPEPPFNPLISVLDVSPPAVYGGELPALSKPTILARVGTLKHAKTATAENDVDMTLRETLTKPSIWASPKKKCDKNPTSDSGSDVNDKLLFQKALPH